MIALTFDIGTTGVKTCLFDVGGHVVPIATESAGYGLTILPGGGAEQNPCDWWAAMCETTTKLFARYPDYRDKVDGISFCSQMQGLVLVDDNCEPVRPAMSYMDQRAADVMREVGGARFGTVAGLKPALLAKAVYHTAAAPASVKDPVWKYLWVKKHEPEVFARVHKWLDVKDSIIAYMTGVCAASEDSAFATLLYDIRSDQPQFSATMLRELGVDSRHMPRIVASTDQVGTLKPDRAAELGVKEGIPVFSGGGDSSLIGVGAGAVGVGDTHVYVGTSGWVSTVTDRTKVDVFSMVASLVGAIHGRYNFFAEMETAGKCLEWVRDHLALDEINLYLSKEDVASGTEAAYTSLYEYLSEVIATAAPGAGGVLFTPWLHGNRCPFEDPNARGSFIGISLSTGKTELLRAVVEGVCFHLRWFLETTDKHFATSKRLRFAGGGALSDTTAQILSDITGRGVDVVARPQDVGAVGAALVVAAGLDPTLDLAHAAAKVQVERSFEPNPDNREVYDRLFEVFVKVYKSNKGIFAGLSKVRDLGDR